MSAIPYKSDDLAASLNTFATRIEPAAERWQYCFDRATYKSRDGLWINQRTLPVCGRIIGRLSPSSVAFRLGKIKRLGWDGALEWAKQWDADKPDWFPQTFAVGPLQQWHIGHLYFARVVSHPHVVKIGFSRRVRERFEDIESKCKTKLFMRPRDIRVGTLADEHWWHKNWAARRISGEWFFDPHTSDRSLPDFLAKHAQAEAA